jgi:hypothetical protein
VFPREIVGGLSAGSKPSVGARLDTQSSGGRRKQPSRRMTVRAEAEAIDAVEMTVSEELTVETRPGITSQPVEGLLLEAFVIGIAIRP